MGLFQLPTAAVPLPPLLDADPIFHPLFGNALHPTLQRYLSQPDRFDFRVIRSVGQIECPDAAAELRGSADLLAASATVDVKSAEAADAAEGTGCQTVTLLGITEADSVQAYAAEVVTLNGTTAVETSTEFKYLLGAYCTSFGTGLKSAGAITVHEHGGTTATYLTIAAGRLCAFETRMRVIAGYSLYSIARITKYVAPAGALAVDANRAVVSWIDLTAARTPSILDEIPMPVPPEGLLYLPADPIGLTGSTAAVRYLSGYSMNTGANTSIAVEIIHLLWSSR